MMGFHEWVNSHVPGAEVLAGDDELIVSAAHPFPFFSQAMRAHERDDGTALIERARELRGDRGFLVVIRPGLDDELEQTVRDRGLPLMLERYPEMICETPIVERPLSDGYELRRVDDFETARAYWRMSSRAYVSLGCPPDLFDEFPPELLLAPEIDAVVAVHDGDVVAGALVANLGGNGYVGWVGTVEEARRKGLGAAVTSRVTNIAFERSAGFVSLEASTMGDPVYPKLGYRELYSYRLYLSPEVQASDAGQISR